MQDEVQSQIDYIICLPSKQIAEDGVGGWWYPSAASTYVAQGFDDQGLNLTTLQRLEELGKEGISWSVKVLGHEGGTLSNPRAFLVV